MPNLVPSDAHVLRPVGTDPRHSFSHTMDLEWAERKKQRKKKVKQIDYSPNGVEKMHVQKKFHSAANRRKLAAQGKALANDSYPIEDTEDLGNAATLARSGHGDVGAAKRLIARRARQLGVANPLTKTPAVAKSADIFSPCSTVFSSLTD